MKHSPHTDNHSTPDKPRTLSSKPVIVNLSDVRPYEVQWLWQDRFALGKVTLLVGDPGLGKSFVTLDMAARVTTGRDWPDGAPGVSGSVVLLSAEDGPADTIRPRMESLGGFADRVDLVQMVKRGNSKNEQPFSLELDLPALAEALSKQWCPKLVVIDPVSAYLGGTDSHKNSDIRELMAPLSNLAERFHVAVVLVTHCNKTTSGPALYRSMGSIGFVALARTAWLVASDPNDHAGERRLLLLLKNNLSSQKTGLAFSIEGKSYDPSSAIVAWDPSPVLESADEVLGDAQQFRARTGKCEQAKAWLREMLAGEPVPATEIKREAKLDGFSTRTIERAKEGLEVVAKRQGFGKEGQWVWELPGHSTPKPSPDDLAANGEADALADPDAHSTPKPPPGDLASYGEAGDLNDPAAHSTPTSEGALAANDDDGVLCTNLEGNTVSEEEPGPDLPKERQVEEDGGRKELEPCPSCGGTHLYTTVFTEDALCGDCMPPPSEDSVNEWL